LKQQLVSATFDDHHQVSLVMASGYVLTVIARRSARADQGRVA
jgi:hypothetical protein